MRPPALRAILCGLAALIITGCAPVERPNRVFDEFFEDVGMDGRTVPPPPGADGGRGAAPVRRGPYTSVGSGQFVSSRAPAVSSMPTPDGGEGYQLNLVDAPIASAAEFVLGEVLGLNYAVDPNLAGTITLQTSQPVSADALLDIFETTLAANGLAISETWGVYRIVEASQAISGTPPVSLPGTLPPGPGVRILVVPLSYIAAQEMRDILAPISPPGAILSFNPEGNYLMLAGTTSELSAMLDAISVFDIDSMQGKSLALHPLESSSPGALASQLQEIFDIEEGAGGDIIRFVPNEQLNSILVVTSQPNYLPRAAEWINRLDRVASTGEPRLFVYPVQNRAAQELALVLQRVLTGETELAGGETVAPDLGEIEVQVDEEAPGLEGLEDEFALVDEAQSIVVADPENNALLINVTPNEYREIEPILRRLDTVPTQVLLEALIVEVTLNDLLRFGVRWFFEHGDGRFAFSDVVTGATGPSFPGFVLNLADSDFEVTLNALSAITDVEVISSPTLMALNNQEAVLQIGDQVPIVTQTAASADPDDLVIVNAVELRDTGIILNIIPRVNSSGGVLLDIEQEASRVIETTTSDIDSPTIQQRRIRTRVSLNDGQALVLGGLIQEGTTRLKDGIPILSDIPVVGNAFRTTEDDFERTELLIFVRPRVIRSSQEAQLVTAEFRRRLDFQEPETFREEATRTLQRLR